MAGVLVAGDAIGAGSLAAFLGDTLSEKYIVVADPQVRGRPLDAVVVGPAGLFVLQTKEWSAARQATAGGAPASADRRLRRDLAAGADTALDALRAFMRDEFPTLKAPLYHLHVVHDPASAAKPWRTLRAAGVAEESVAESLASPDLPADAVLGEEENREAIANALREHRLTASQRASQPFVFHTSGGLGAGIKAWTIRAVVQHMDRHPQDGIHHLRNGTLANWLAAEGAEHLAALARQSLAEARSDDRMALELFVTGSRLVKRPPLKVRPHKLELGLIAEGDKASAPFRIRRGGGYLFGRMEASTPWLRVEPEVFTGEPVRGHINVATNTLLIRAEPYQAEVRIGTGPANPEVVLPVRFRVAAVPSSGSRLLIRPAVILLLAGLLGAAIGLLWDALGLGATAITRSPALASAGYPWTILFGCVWAALGAVWALLAPKNWPVGLAVRRFLVQCIVWWLVGLIVALAAGLWSLGWNVRQFPIGAFLAASLALALPAAIAPVALGALAAARRRRVHEKGAGTSRLRRWMPVLVTIGVLILIVGAVAFVVSSPANVAAVQNGLNVASAGVAQGWDWLDARVAALVDKLTMSYYERNVR